jgi:hypothetical protein
MPYFLKLLCYLMLPSFILHHNRYCLTLSNKKQHVSLAIRLKMSIDVIQNCICWIRWSEWVFEKFAGQLKCTVCFTKLQLKKAKRIAWLSFGLGFHINKRDWFSPFPLNEKLYHFIWNASYILVLIFSANTKFYCR